MTLTVRSRQVGDISVVTCAGRLVEGAEANALRQQLIDLLAFDARVVVDVGGLTFIDSSALGLLVRLLTRAQALQGDLKLCSVQKDFETILKVTRLRALFDIHPSEQHALEAFYHHDPAPVSPDRIGAAVLCVDRSADVLAFVRELLKQAGYRVLSVDNVSDALILLKAVRPRMVLVSHELRAMRGNATVEAFNGLLDELVTIELPATFSGDEAGHAAKALLARIESETT